MSTLLLVARCQIMVIPMATTKTPKARKAKRKPLTAKQFILQLGDNGLNDTHYATQISLTTLRSYLSDGRKLSIDTANVLQDWSLERPGKTYISAVRTLGVRPEIA